MCPLCIDEAPGDFEDAEFVKVLNPKWIRIFGCHHEIDSGSLVAF